MAEAEPYLYLRIAAYLPHQERICHIAANELSSNAIRNPNWPVKEFIAAKGHRPDAISTRIMLKRFPRNTRV